MFVDALKDAKAKKGSFEPENVQEISGQNPLPRPVQIALLALKDDFREIDWVSEFGDLDLLQKQLNRFLAL